MAANLTEPFVCPPEYSLAAMEQKKREIWSLLLAFRPGGDGAATLYIFAAGKPVRVVMGRLDTIRENYLPLYAGCELRECWPLRMGEPVEQAFAASEKSRTIIGTEQTSGVGVSA